MMLAVGLSCVDFIMLRNASIPNVFRAFIMKGGSILSKDFSASIEIMMWVLYLILFMCCIMFIYLHMCTSVLASLE
jgi:uncharacterized membrane protein YoaK (UPF0700 family)